MTPHVLLSLQSIRRELGAEEITVVCNERGVEMWAGDDLLFVDMLPEAARVEPAPEPEPAGLAPPARTPWPTSADRMEAPSVVPARFRSTSAPRTNGMPD